MKQAVDYRYLGKSIPGRRNCKKKGLRWNMLTFGRNSRRNRCDWNRVRGLVVYEVRDLIGPD